MKEIPQRIILFGLIIYSTFVTTSTSLQRGGICLGILGLIPLFFLDYKRLKGIPFNLPILCFIIALILSSLFSQSPMASLLKTGSIARKILIYYLVTIGVSESKWAKRLIYLTLIGAGIGAIYTFAIESFHLSEKILSFNRSLGGACGMLVPLGICMCFIASLKVQRIGFSVISFFLLILLLLTSTRGAYFGAIIAIIFMSLGKKRVLLFLLIFLLFSFILPINQRLIQTFNPNYFPNLERIYIWKKGLEIIKDNPLFGIGPAGIETIYNGNRQIRHYHNNFLEIGVKGGLLSLSAFIWLLVAIIRFCCKALKNEEHFVLKFGLCASLIDWFIHGLVDTTYVGNLGYLFWFILGLLVLLQRNGA
ncbi:MAG: O-antigen ligase family protein [bacterium]